MKKLEFKAIAKIFPGVRALDGVSFSLETGEVHGLVGENGAGKSTLIKIVSGALSAEQGEMILDGAPFRPKSPRDALAAGIATIYQEKSFLSFRKVMFNIMLGQEPRGALGALDFAMMRNECRRVLKLLNSENIPLEAKAETLKAGQIQILEIAHALVHKSSLLIMDEPTSALNQEEREALFQLVGALKAQGLTILYVSHRLEEIFKLADRVTVLRDGRHIKTVAVRDTTRDELISDMVGRQWTGAFPARNAELGETVLEADQISGKGFSEISFQLRRGEILGITGLAGSGKEELGQALFGAYPISRGRVRVSGKAIELNPWSAIKAGMAYLPEDRKTEGIISALSVRRNISLPVLRKLSGSFGRILGRKEDELAQGWVKRLDIKTTGLEQLCETLSGGNQQKVVLAKWLASEAKVIILAYPTQEVDVVVKFELYRQVAQLSRAGVSFILISSDLPEVLGLSHSVMVMRDGGIAARLAAEPADTETVLRYALGETKAQVTRSRPALQENRNSL